MNMPTLNQIAKTIVGPNEAHHIGPAKLLELQDLKWGRLKSQEQSHFLRAARYVLELFESEPDGYVILNGDNTKARFWDDGWPEHSRTPGWTDDLDKALWFARRADAEAFGKEDEDAWCVLRASEIRRMWAGRLPVITSQGASNVTPIAVNVPGGVRPPPLPGAALLEADDRSAHHLLMQFRSYVQKVAGWVGTHHHPIWADVAAELDEHDLNVDPTSGPDWLFTQPDNRKSFTELRREFLAKGGNIA